MGTYNTIWLLRGPYNTIMPLLGANNTIWPLWGHIIQYEGLRVCVTFQWEGRVKLPGDQVTVGILAPPTDALVAHEGTLDDVTRMLTLTVNQHYLGVFRQETAAYLYSLDEDTCGEV